MAFENPWQVDNLQSFLFLNCPECVFKTKKPKSFQNHALSKHHLSKVLFSEVAESKTFENLKLEQEEISKSNLILEQIMYEEEMDYDCGLESNPIQIEPKRKGIGKESELSEAEFSNEKELYHLCNFCNHSFKNILELKTHIKRHQNVLPVALFAPKPPRQLKIPKYVTNDAINVLKGYKNAKDEILKCHIGDCKFETTGNGSLNLHLKG